MRIQEQQAEREIRRERFDEKADSKEKLDVTVVYTKIEEFSYERETNGIGRVDEEE